MMRPSKTRLLIAHLVLWSVILGLVIIIVGLLSLEASRDLKDWSTWLDTNKSLLLIWRLALYSVTATAWYQMRRNLVSRGLTPHQHQRLLCTEVAAIGVLTLLELSVFTTDSRPRPLP